MGLFHLGAEAQFYPTSKYEGRVHQFGTQVLLGILMGYALNAESGWAGNLLIVDSEDLRRGGGCKEKQRICIPMQDERNLTRKTAVIHCCVQSGERSQARPSTKLSRRKRRSPRSRSGCWISTRFVKYYGRLHISCCTKNKTLCSEIRFSDTSESHWCPEINENERWCTSWGKHRGLLGLIGGRKSLSERWIAMTRVEPLNKKIHQKDTCGFKADWQRHRLLQDLDIFGRKNGQECRKTLSAKP